MRYHTIGVRYTCMTHPPQKTKVLKDPYKYFRLLTPNAAMSV